MLPGIASVIVLVIGIVLFIIFRLNYSSLKNSHSISIPTQVRYKELLRQQKVLKTEKVRYISEIPQLSVQGLLKLI